ncbi:DUF6476 family protein [Benzoatithermus flavus]|uniref:DUF6476 family protein n=1 Tax=Benzoatithermus flavus TaxID=3108223 RepID=A0ABU8XTZ7_9PROT
MSDSLLKALKIVVVVGAVVIVGGTATLIWLLVKRGTSMAVATVQAPSPPSVPGTVELPPGAEITQIAAAGPELLLLGRAPGEGQFLLVVDAKSGTRRRILRLVETRP